MGKNQTSFTNGHKSSSIKNEIGNKYGKLTVLSREENDRFGNARWLCSCECGKLKVASGTSLRNGSTKSCGCAVYEANKSRRSGKSVFKKLYQSIKTQSLKKDIPFNLTEIDVERMSLEKCTYCGREPYLEKRAYMTVSYTKGEEYDEKLLINGIDKVIPELGYTKDNCVSCCKYCNRAKSDLSLNDFKTLISLIYNNYVRT